MAGFGVLIPAVIAVIIAARIQKRMDTGKRVDQGMEFCYWNLSYRRKFIRTLWMIPIWILLVILLHTTFQSCIFTCIIGGLSGILLWIQAVYNYKKWKEENR